jgi:hypothetical protein
MFGLLTRNKGDTKMATISKKISETDYEEIGNTQGLLIPRDREPDFDSGIITDVTSGSKELTHNLNTSMTNLDIVVMFRRTSDQSWQRFDSQLYHVSGSNYGFAFGEINLNTMALFIADTGPIILTNAFATLASATDAFRVICWKRTERVPYIIANKGALVSSDEMGKVKIDSDDGTMSISGELGTNGANQVSLNRPDLWPDRTEIDFGNGLFGKRFSGTFTGTSVLSIGMGITGTTPATFKVVNMGGWAVLNSETNGGLAFGHGEIYVVGDNTYTQVLRIDSSSVRTNAPYDVWVTYRK